jgi:ADP-ribose pyrophosphatase
MPGWASSLTDHYHAEVAKSKKQRSAKDDVEVISSKLVFDGPAFKVFSDRVREGEHTGRRDVVRHTGSVVIMGLEERKDEMPRVLLVSQYRYAANLRLWELPAGRIDGGEAKLPAAKREFREETGFTAAKWSHAFMFYASPGFLDETMDVFIARGLKAGKAQPEEDEQITAKFFPLGRTVQMAMQNEICDAKTMTAVLWLERKLRKRL